MQADLEESLAATAGLRRTSASTGLPIKERPIIDPLSVSKVERGRPLTLAEMDEWLADHQYALNHGSGSPTLEIAFELRQMVRDFQALHLGTWNERLDAVAREMLAADNNLINLAGYHVKIALTMMAAETDLESAEAKVKAKA